MPFFLNVQAQTGVVVLGYSNARGNDETKKNLMIREYCAIYKAAEEKKIKSLILTDPIECEEGVIIGACGSEGCDYRNSKILANFISIHRIKNLKVYVLTHGVQNVMVYGRPPESNEIDLGEEAQNINSIELSNFFINAIETKINSIKFYFASCYSGGFHEVTMRVLESNKVINACSLSQASHRRVVTISSEEIINSKILFFTQSFIELLTSSMYTSLSKIAEIEKKHNYPTIPGMKTWLTSSMYYVDKFTETGFFNNDEKNNTENLKILDIPFYPNANPIKEPSYFSNGLRDFSASELEASLKFASKKLTMDQQKKLAMMVSCERQL